MEKFEVHVLKLKYKQEHLTIEYGIRRGGERVILYLHGAACAKEDFLDTIDANAFKDFKLIAFDYPGCGNSSYPKKTGCTVDDLVEITQMIILKLRLQNLHLIGHSTGGLVALLFIAKYGHVMSFASIEGNLHQDNCRFSQTVLQQSREHFLQDGKRRLITELQSSENKGLQKWADHLSLSATACAFYDLCPSLVAYSTDTKLMRMFCRLEIPKIYIFGSENKARLSFLGDLKKNQCCQLVEIPKSNHFPFYDNPEKLYSALSDFYKTGQDALF